MKSYLISIITQLINYSDTLNKTSILIDKPWALIDEESEIQKLIFKKNKELILSKNGSVQIGKWDYFPEAKSLLIDRVTDTILCNEVFIDKGALVLKLDGTESKFFILANENIIPDLDIFNYLKGIRNQMLSITEKILLDGRTLEIHLDSEWQVINLRNSVTIENKNVPDGKYKFENLTRKEYNKEKCQFQYYEIKNGSIHKILTEVYHLNPDGQQITIHQQNYWKITRGDYAYIIDKQIDNQIINFNKFENIIVRDGIVIGRVYKKKFIGLILKISRKIRAFYKV